MSCYIGDYEDMLSEVGKRKEIGVCDECHAQGEVTVTLWGEERDCENEDFEPDEFWGKCINQKCFDRKDCDHDIHGGYIITTEETCRSCSECEEDYEILTFYKGCVTFLQKRENNLANLKEIFSETDHQGLKRILLFQVILPLRRRIRKNLKKLNEGKTT